MKQTRHLWRSWTWGLIDTLCVCVGVLTLIGFCGRWWWVFDLASHFRFQYFWLLGAATVVLIVARRFLAGTVVASFAIVNVCLVAPLYQGQSARVPSQIPSQIPSQVRLLSVNVGKGNQQFKRGVKFVGGSKPDIVVLIEATPGWVDAMNQQEGQYQTAFAIPRNDSQGIALYSRFPLVDATVKKLPGGVPAIVARLDVDGQLLTVIAAHTKPPIGPLYTQNRNQQIARLGDIAGSYDGAVTLVGDLNTTSWSACFQDLVERADLRDSRHGFGVQGSWPAGPPRPFQIPIDHCLVSKEIDVVDRRVAQDIGSDHFPVIVDFSIQSGSLAAADSARIGQGPKEVGKRAHATGQRGTSQPATEHRATAERKSSDAG